MTRVKGGTVARARRKKVLKEAKGYFGSKHRLYKTAHEQVMHSGVYAFRDRKQNKRNFRKLWITRINAGCRENEISYSRFIDGLNKAGVTVNRKMLSELAIDNPKKTALLSSYTTTPYVRKILLDIIDIMKIEKQSDQIEKDYEWNDKKYYEVENVIGKTKSEAKKLLTGFDISYVGDGNIVKEQTPKAGERYYQTGKIRLLMGE